MFFYAGKSAIICFIFFRKGGVSLKTDFFKGIRDGIPICLGYLSVSFGFGILAVGLGLSVLSAVGISLKDFSNYSAA